MQIDPIATYRGDLTVTASLLRHARSTPHRVALINGPLTLTYAQTASAAGAIATKLVKAGVRAGDRVCIPTDLPLHHLIGVLGTLWIGATAVPLPTDDLSRQAIVADCEPVLTLEVGDLQTDGSDYPPLHDPSPRELAMFLYTSGTTSGVRKGVMQSYLQLHNTVHYITKVMKMDETIREYVASPIDTAFWYGRCRCIIHVGGTAVLATGRLNPHAIVGAVDKHALNAIAGDTPIFLLLLHHLRAHFERIGADLDQQPDLCRASRCLRLFDLAANRPPRRQCLPPFVPLGTNEAGKPQSCFLGWQQLFAAAARWPAPQRLWPSWLS